MRIGSLFSGYGGLSLACGAVFGGTTAWVSDVDKGANKVLAHRFPDAPNLGDITKVDWSAIEPVDVLDGGFPCQDLSHAGKRAGMRPGTRSGMWTHMAYAISELRPRYVVAENVRGLLSGKAHSDMERCPYCMGGGGDGEPDVRALGTVLGDLANLGYDAQWCGLRASDVGAPHGRFRVFILATAQNANGAVSREWRESAPGQAEGGRARADVGGRDRASFADTQSHVGWTGQLGQNDAAERSTRDDELSGSRECSVADTSGERHGRGQDDREVGRLDGNSAGEARKRKRSREVASDRGSEISWGAYGPVIRRWERVLGRLAPAPTILAPKGGQRLNPKLNEWMMGLPDGWITDVPEVTRNEALKLAGNGVVPQQAEVALRFMLRRT